MKISLLCASIDGLGGAEALVRMLASGLVDRGHDVQVISLDPGTFPELAGLGFKHCPIQSKATDKYAARDSHGAVYKAIWQLRCLRNPALLSKLERMLQMHGPHVIHTHKVRGFPQKLWPCVKKYSGSALVHTCHDIELLTPLHTISMTSSNPVKTALLNLWSKAGKTSSTQVDAVTSPSQFMLNLHLTRGFFGLAESMVVSNFPDLAPGSELMPMDNPDSGDPLKILFIGRLIRVKGILTLCEAVAQVVKEGGQIKLRVAGFGLLEAEVQRYCDQYDFISFEGKVQHQEKAELLQWAHVVVTPTECDESFCLVAAEALTAARPVLASSRGGLPEVVKDNVSGWVYTGEGVAALKGGIRRVIKSRGELVTFSRRAKNEARRFMPSLLIDAYESLYNELAADDSSTGTL